MHLVEALTQEIELLSLFELSTTREGIKVHSTAGDPRVKAVKRLYDKGLVTQIDGGYLTSLGRDAAAHAQSLLMILTSAETA